MYGGLRVDVREGEAVVILEDAPDRDGAGGDLAEDAVGGHGEIVRRGRLSPRLSVKGTYPRRIVSFSQREHYSDSERYPVIRL